jgi:hypothetical protein
MGGEAVPVQNIWWWAVRPFVENETQTWSMDITNTIVPAQTVYAFVAMQCLEYSGDGGAAFGGISAYTTSGTAHEVGANQRNGVMPAIFDNSVDSVTFAWGLSAPPLEDVSNVNNTVSADFSFQIFGWG